MIRASELILNSDGTLFHLHILPQHVAENVIIVGDPARCDLIASYFDRVILRASNREFVTIFGICDGKPLTVISSGIGCDNIDILMTELDAAVNIDLETRTIKPNLKRLNIFRLGTSGGVQDEIRIGDCIMSEYSIGIDGLAHFYDDSKRVRELAFEDDFFAKTNWGADMAKPYIVKNDPGLVERFSSFAKRGVTISTGGFYAPQGRVVRLGLWCEDYLRNIENYNYNGLKVTNFEMESSAIAFLGAMLGHRCLTICAVIAQRKKGESDPDYGKIVKNLIENSLQLICK